MTQSTATMSPWHSLSHKVCKVSSGHTNRPASERRRASDVRAARGTGGGGFGPSQHPAGGGGFVRTAGLVTSYPHAAMPPVSSVPPPPQGVGRPTEAESVLLNLCKMLVHSVDFLVFFLLLLLMLLLL